MSAPSRTDSRASRLPHRWVVVGICLHLIALITSLGALALAPRAPSPILLSVGGLLGSWNRMHGGRRAFSVLTSVPREMTSAAYSASRIHSRRYTIRSVAMRGSAGRGPHRCTLPIVASG